MSRLRSIREYDQAITAADPTPDLSEQERLTRFVSLANLYRGRAQQWFAIADRYGNDDLVPGVLVEAARRAAAADEMSAQRWESHRELVMRRS